MTTAAEPVIRVRDLVKEFRGYRAVDEVDLTVHRGEVVAVLGPNGAGKTTTVEMMLGLRRPTSGDVEVFGRPPNDMAVRRRVGAMLQDTDAQKALTVSEVIDLVRHYYPSPLDVDDVLHRADLVEQRRTRVGRLSGGLRQRLSFAIAICGDPDLLYLDEPTAALDVQSRRRFWGQVRDLAGSGRTVVLTTHNLTEAQTLADRIVLIAAGRVVAQGSPDEIARTVSGSLVRLATDADPSALADRAGVSAVRREAGHLVIHTAQPELLLRDLFAGGHTVDDLTVTTADLETAFMHLVGDHDTRPQERVTA